MSSASAQMSSTPTCVTTKRKGRHIKFTTVSSSSSGRVDLEKELNIKYEMYDEDQGSCEVCNI